MELCGKLCLEDWEHMYRSIGVALLLVPPNLFAMMEISENPWRSFIFGCFFKGKYNMFRLPPYGWIMKVNGGNPKHLSIPLSAESWNTSLEHLWSYVVVVVSDPTKHSEIQEHKWSFMPNAIMWDTRRQTQQTEQLPSDSWLNMSIQRQSKEIFS